jgi:hypothetical protein
VRRPTTMLASATAAALAALAVSVAGIAIADEGPKIDEPRVKDPGATVERDLRRCLEQHGADIEGSDPAAIKRWIVEHADDPEARDAMKACHIVWPGASPAPGCGDKDGPRPDKPAVGGAPELKKPAPAPDTPAGV